MERRRIKTFTIKYLHWFAIVYAFIWLAPGIVVYPVDFINEAITGIKYVDGWTLGIMFWTGSVIFLPILFLVFLLIFYIVKQIENRSR